ncbi:SURF1 family protein [Sabulicella rubraurantiaca]|uniref:SURF1 family protein n=1 Tax=Sabulicella rubraurantiaca TaxID=2811429 RepID=UPI001A973F01|nr:SURF1 family protein [Sabulicella rubraurantiaca]
MSQHGPARGGRPWRALILPSFFAIPVLALLLGLGTWQMQRLGWKTALLEELAERQSRPPIEAPARPEPFAHIRATGRFRPGAEAFLGLEVRGSLLGGSLLAILDRQGAPPLLVNRGWAPFEGGRVERPEGVVTVSGYARFGERRGLFTPRDDPGERRFLHFGPVAIAGALGAPDAPAYALVVVEPGPATAPSGFGAAPAPARATLPDPATGFPSPSNPHLGYAITWFGLAIGWVVIFGLWAHRRLREPA